MNASLHALRVLVFTLAAPLFLSACSAAEQGGTGTVILAASSMQEAMTDAANAWAAEGHAAPTLAFAASSALARQIEGGAPADIYLPADEQWMDRMEGLDLLRPGTRSDLLTNELVLIAPKEDGEADWNMTRGALLNRLGDDGRLAIADPQGVPAGRYARAALTHLDLWNAVANRLAVAENVRASLALVERGEAPLGVVYKTDSMASDKVRILATFPADSHPPIRYPVAVLASSDSRGAEAFMAFLKSPEAGAIFARRGFGLVE
ncbi:molybdate transport system substrate-binding protein [Altererythrobacter atlanticus]|nr:molybdate ABC transporter substrate-binding protein [Croceibacterium atlanticum]MBB5731401.1 molybdate transport system substrate-binding protein [Croceibacterium atlanticum]